MLMMRDRAAVPYAYQETMFINGISIKVIDTYVFDKFYFLIHVLQGYLAHKKLPPPLEPP